MKRKSLSYLRLLLVNAAFLFVLTGCATKQMKLTQTGFLSSYSDLKEDEEFKDMHIYRNPNVDIGERYSKVLIAPVQFRLNPNEEEYGMREGDKEKLSSYFLEQLEKRLIKNYEIVNGPGEGTLLFRSAITDVLPNKVYLNLHWTTTLMGAGTGGASLEAELVDSLTGERMMSFVDARKGKRIKYTKGLTKWGHTKGVLGAWADVVVANLDRLKEER